MTAAPVRHVISTIRVIASDRVRYFTPATQFWMLQIALPAAGLGLLIAGHSLGWPRLMSTGVFVLGATGVAAGGACMLLRRITFARRGWGFELWVWHGTAAVFIGAAFAVLGSALAATALMHLGGTELMEIGARFRARPGLLLVPVGLALLLGGIGAFIGFRNAGEMGRSEIWNFVLSVPDRLAGAILIVIGAAALIVGLWEMGAEASFDRWVGERIAHP